MEKFLSAFKTSGITENFMVNGRWSRAGSSKFEHSSFWNESFSNSPIVKAMLKSTVDNGLTRYENEESKSFIWALIRKLDRRYWKLFQRF